MRSLLTIPLAMANTLAFFGVPSTTQVFPASWPVNLSVEECITVLALVILGIEVWRATAPTPRTALHHVGTLGLLLATIVEFGFLPAARTGLFMVLIVAVAVDLIVGCYITFTNKAKSIWVDNK